LTGQKAPIERVGWERKRIITEGRRETAGGNVSLAQKGDVQKNALLGNTMSNDSAFMNGIKKNKRCCVHCPPESTAQRKAPVKETKRVEERSLGSHSCTRMDTSHNGPREKSYSRDGSSIKGKDSSRKKECTTSI